MVSRLEIQRENLFVFAERLSGDGPAPERVACGKAGPENATDFRGSSRIYLFDLLVVGLVRANPRKSVA